MIVVVVAQELVDEAVLLGVLDGVDEASPASSVPSDVQPDPVQPPLMQFEPVYDCSEHLEPVQVCDPLLQSTAQVSVELHREQINLPRPMQPNEIQLRPKHVPVPSQSEPRQPEVEHPLAEHSPLPHPKPRQPITIQFNSLHLLVELSQSDPVQPREIQKMPWHFPLTQSGL